MTLNLFQEHLSKTKQLPLAERMRPKSFEEIIGHSEWIGKGSVLEKAVEKKQLFSFVLWGPSGVGKTTISKLIAQKVGGNFLPLSAVSSGTKEIRSVIASAKYSTKVSILFIDEIHRFNKVQQDVLLDAVERGILILIGATTENPSFEINPALLSRLRVFRLEELTKEDLEKIVYRALTIDVFLKRRKIKIVDIDYLVQLSKGDGRRCLSILETGVLLEGNKEVIVFDKNVLKKTAKTLTNSYDKKSDYHYDTLSAFIKSIRGSDPDAAILWLARMLDGGEDPMVISRRLVISASEDIGNSDPTALVLAVNGMQAVQMIGLPEARIILGQITTYLASTYKSNASYKAIDDALADVKRQKVTVPLSLRNPVTSLMKRENYGKGYLYAHDYNGNFVEQNYFPKEIKKRIYYHLTSQGHEGQLKKRLERLWKRHYDELDKK